MKLFFTIKKAAQLVKGIWNWLEAGLPFLTGQQGWIPSIVQDARWDLNFVTRRELLRKARYFAQNSPFIKRIIEIDQVYTIGANGLHLSPQSSDEDWNERAKEVFEEWAVTAGLQGESLTDLMHIGHFCERTDGEIFMLKTRRAWMQSELDRRAENGDARRIVGSRPCLQLVEGHRVETPMGKWNEDITDIVDGVQMDRIVLPGGRKLQVKKGFWVRDSLGNFDMDDTYNLVPLDGIIQIGEAQRANQLRYVSCFYATLMTFGDFNELLKCEAMAAKDGAEKTTVLTNASGEADPATLFKAAFNKSGVAAQGDSPDVKWEKYGQWFQKKVGGRALTLRTGEDVKQFMNNRPTVASREYWLFLISVICAGLGMSILLVFPDFSDNNQGTAIRAELDIADEVFKRRSRKWKAAYCDIWEYVMGWAIKNDVRVSDPPPDWRKVQVQSPKAVNVDAGRNASVDAAALADGRLNYKTYYGQQGKDWRTELKQTATEEDYCKKIGLQRIVTQRGNVILVEPSDVDPMGNPTNPQPQPQPRKGQKRTQNA
jgi:capsid protein